MWIPRGDIELDILAKGVNIQDGISQDDWVITDIIDCYKQEDRILKQTCD